MSEFDSEEFQEVMLLELTERVQELNSALLILEKDPKRQSAHDDILRTLHNLKGLFSLSGYPSISTLTHRIEELVTNLDTSDKAKVIQTLFAYTDELERFSKTLKGGNTPELLRFDQLTQQLASIDEFMINLGNQFRIKVLFSPDCKVISARSLVLIKKLQECATVNRTDPPLEDIELGVSVKELVIELTTQEDEETVAKTIKESQDVSTVSISRIFEPATLGKSGGTEETQEPLTVRVNLRDLDQIITLLGDLVVSGQFIREIGEQQAYTRSFKENLSSFERTIANIQDLVIKMRLVPLETILTRFPRMIRDLSQKEGKSVDFNIIGKYIGVDRSIIEQLVDPLNHLLRNALSHGIELPNERIEKNKDPTGTIKLNITHERSDIIIEVWDDGRGIDYDKIRKNAEERGLVSSGVLLTREDVHTMLFSNNFSTADETTEISGRGIGLNVVKQAIEKIGGIIEINSEPGLNTSIRLIIPLSVAIMKVLLMTVKDQPFAIPMANVDQILSVPTKKVLVDPNTNSKSIIVNEHPIHLIDLRDTFTFNSSQSYENEKSSITKHSESEIVVLWRKGTRSLGFIVNEMLGERDVVMKPIHNFISQVGAFSGATVLEGGQVVLIIDPLNFLEARVHA